MTANNQTDPFLAHEALDRASMLAEMVENYLLYHPYVAFRSDVKALVEQAANALQLAYQRIGDKTL